MFDDLGRLLVLLGGVLLAAGIGIMLLGRIPGFGSLPGDIVIQRDGFSCFVPIISMLLLSLILTIVVNVIGRFLR